MNPINGVLTFLLTQVFRLWNGGSVIALAHVQVPFFSSVYTDARAFDYRTGYVFGVRIFRYRVVSS